MYREDKIMLASTIGVFLVIAGLFVWALVTPGDPNAKVCPVVGNIAICEE